MDAFEKTLRKIEKLEKTWRYELSDEEDMQHSFGRVPEDKKTIAFWSAPRSTGEFLRFMIEVTNSKVILELGCSAGYSTLFLAKGAELTGGHVCTTEIFKPKIVLAQKHFKEAKLSEKITLYENDIKHVLEKWDKSLHVDLVFMDADKENYEKYYELSLPIMKKHGLIIVDNAGKVKMTDGSFVDSEHIKNFVKKVKSDKRVSTVYLNFDNGILLAYKK